MAKKAYFGVVDLARKIKKFYLGGEKEQLPIYETVVTGEDVLVTADNISKYFTVTNSSYYFKGSGSTFTTTNGGVNSSTGQTTLTSLVTCPISFDYSYSSEASCDKLTITVAGTTIANGLSGSTTNKSYSGTIKAGDQLVFKYTKDGSVHSNLDKCTFSNMMLALKKEEQVVVGYDEKSFAKKIRKAYVGVQGVARPCWNGGELVYYGTATPLTYQDASLYPCGFSVGSYAAMYYGRYIEAYDSALTHTTPETSWYTTSSLASGETQNHAIVNGFGYEFVVVINSDLTNNRSDSSFSRYYEVAGAKAGAYAVFVGGQYGGSTNPYILAFNDNMSSTAIAGGSNTRSPTFSGMARRAVFAGGLNGNNAPSAAVSAINDDLSKSVLSQMQTGRWNHASVGTENHIVIAGGQLASGSGSSVWLSSADAYNDSLTKLTVAPLSHRKIELGGANVDGFILFCGGGGEDGAGTSVDVYTDDTLTKIQAPLALGSSRVYVTSANIADYALIASANYNRQVDVYTVA